MDCLLADLVKLVDPELSDKNISCIKPLSKGIRDKIFAGFNLREEMKKNWELKHGGACGEYDVSSLVGQGENAISLQVGKDLEPNGFSDNAARFYDAKFTSDPYGAIESASGMGEKPLTSVTLVGHGIARKPGLFGQGVLMGDDWLETDAGKNWYKANPDAFLKYIPKTANAWEFPSFVDAENGKRPFGCWFAKDAKVRFVGCNTESFADRFASKYLRTTAVAYGTERFVWAGSKGLGFFPNFNPPTPLKPLDDDWYDDAEGFNKSQYWQEFFGKN